MANQKVSRNGDGTPYEHVATPGWDNSGPDDPNPPGKNENAIAHIPDDDRTELLQFFQKRGKQQFVANFSPFTSEGALAALSIEAVEQTPIADNCPVTINVVFCLIREAESVNKDSGEIESKVRCILIDDAGKVWSTQSAVAGRTITTLLSTPAGSSPFNPPVPLSFARVGDGSRKALTCKTDPATLKRLFGG